MFSIGYAIYLYFFATALAALEIQIEGQHGWAEKLPCWRPKPSSIIARTWYKLTGGKPLTGYHLSIIALIFISLHLPFAAGIAWTLIKELEVFSAYFLLAPFWDFHWFIWNPAYGLKRFKPKYIWWFKDWIGRIPLDYPIYLIVSVLFALIASILEKMNILLNWATTFGVMMGLTLISCLIASLLKRGKE